MSVTAVVAKRLSSASLFGIGFMVCALSAGRSLADAPASADDKVDRRVASQGTREEGRPIRFELVDERTNATLVLDIPAGYLSRDVRKASGRVERVVIETGLPDMKPRRALLHPRSAPDAPGYADEMAIWRNGAYVILRDREVSSAFPTNSYEYARKRLRRLPGDQAGLEGFRDYVCMGRQQILADPTRSAKLREQARQNTEDPICWPFGHEIFFAPPGVPLDKWVRMYCNPVEDGPAGGCIADAIYRGKGLKYIFRRTELGRWQEFDRAVRALLDRFVVSDTRRN